MMTMLSCKRGLLAIAAGTLVMAAHVAAQPALTFTAMASVKTPSASGSRPVTIRIDRFVPDADRDALLATVKAHKPGETLRALTSREDIGYIQVGDKRVPIKFAYARPVGDGRMITVMTAQPILFFSADGKTKPKEGFDLGLALLVLDARDTGEGELAPAAKVAINKDGAIVTEEYGSEMVRLEKIARVK